MNRPALIEIGPVRMTQVKAIPLVRLSDIEPQRQPEPQAIGRIVVSMTRGEITHAAGQAKLIAAGLPHTRARELALCAANNLKTRI